jgi:hypothetical protein
MVLMAGRLLTGHLFSQIPQPTQIVSNFLPVLHGILKNLG